MRNVHQSPSIDFTSINTAALARCPDLLLRLLPGGSPRGREYVAANLSGGPGDSLSINTSSGVWKDFATGEGGSDLVSLVAAVRGTEQGEAARALSEMVGVTAPVVDTRRQGKEASAIIPIPEGIPEPNTRHPRLGAPSAVFTYRDPAGRLLGYVCRFNKAEAGSKGKPQKEFSPLVWTSQGWKWQALPAPRPLYGLEKLAQVAPEASVLVLEGEGKADAVQHVLGPNVAVLSLNGGSSGIAKLDLSPLHGRKVIYWPDADEPGEKAARQFVAVARNAGVASAAVVVPPDGVPQGWDAGDAVKEGWGRAQLIAHIKGNQREEAPAEESGESETTESAMLPPPPAVPLKAFPSEVAAMLEEAAEAFTVPLQIPAACLLGVLSCLVGGTRLISLRPSWKEPGNIWIATVAASGIGKTPCAAEFFRPVKNLEYTAFKEWQEAYASYENELEFCRKERAKAKRGDTLPDRPVPPKRRQAYVDDATGEALGEVLAENPRGIMWRRDELAGLIADLDKYSANGSGGGTRSRLLSSYDGQEWKTSRTSNPTRNLYIPHAYVGIFGGIQPAMLPKVFEAGSDGTDEASGFLQRFMLIRAERERPGYWTERYLSHESKSLLATIVAALWAWDIEYDDEGREEEKVVPVSRQAKAVFIEWFNGIAQEEFLSQNAALLSKLKGQAQRICLLLHCLDAALSGNDGMGLVTEDTMRRALLLADWVKEHQGQCWRFFTPEKGAKQADPIERAIMAVVVDEAARIEADGWRISNADLCAGVERILNMPGLSAVKIGKAASGLGLPVCWATPKTKGRTVTQEKILSFKTTVGSVGSVGSLSGTKEKLTNTTVGHPLVTVGSDLSAWASTNGTNGTPTVSVGKKSVETVGQPTEPTEPTVDSGYNLDFNDPAFSDEDRVEI